MICDWTNKLPKQQIFWGRDALQMKWYCMLLYCFVLHVLHATWEPNFVCKMDTWAMVMLVLILYGSVLSLVYLSFVLYWSMGLPLLNLSLEPYLDLLKKWQTMAMVFHVMEWNCMVYLGACCKASNVDVILDKLWLSYWEILLQFCHSADKR